MQNFDATAGDSMVAQRLALEYQKRCEVAMLAAYLQRLTTDIPREIDQQIRRATTHLVHGRAVIRIRVLLPGPDALRR